MSVLLFIAHHPGALSKKEHLCVSLLDLVPQNSYGNDGDLTRKVKDF